MSIYHIRMSCVRGKTFCILRRVKNPPIRWVGGPDKQCDTFSNSKSAEACPSAGMADAEVAMLAGSEDSSLYASGMEPM